MKAFQLFGRIALQRGGLTAAWMLNRLYVVIADATAAGVVTRRCLDKDEATMGFIRTLLGNGSIFAPVEIWRPRRKTLAPVFAVRRVAAFVGLFDRHAAAAVEQLRAHAGKGDFSLWDTLSAYTFDAVCETSLGVQFRSQGGTPHPFLRAFAGAQRELARRMCAPWLYPDVVYRALPPYRRFVRSRRYIHTFIDEIIREKQKEMSISESKESSSSDADSGHKSFLELMLESGEYSSLELREEVMVLVMAGSDTTAVGAAFALLLLAAHPAVQRRARQELVEVLGDGSGAMTAASLARLKYLEAVVREALRLYPPVPVTVREVREPLQLSCGLVLPAGVGVLLNTWATHRSPAYWGADAELFRPERFLQPLRHPAQFMPFGHSTRNCLGSQYAMLAMKTVLARTLLQLRVLPATDTPAAAVTAAADTNHADAATYHADAATKHAAADTNNADAGTNNAAADTNDAAADTTAPADDTSPPLRVKFDIAMKHVDNYMVRMELLE
ncbi:cytochrome P450 4C1-like isoform X2 [Leguminivora glycinivorella]|nr:cytochrome P450 4C1-like isoform X2 [Leguminivora glycinivorella]